MVEGKNILVVGLANKYSIAAAISSSLYENGATLGFSYQNERFLVIALTFTITTSLANMKPSPIGSTIFT